MGTRRIARYIRVANNLHLWLPTLMGRFAKELDAIMTQRSVSDQTLADAIPSARTGRKTTAAYIWKLRTGKRSPGAAVARLIASYFGGQDGERLVSAQLKDDTPPEMLARFRSEHGTPGDALDESLAAVRAKCDGLQLDALSRVLVTIARDPVFWLAAIDGMIRYEYSRRPRNGDGGGK